MPRKVLRQFTGGISNEIDAQNLRDDQGEEAVDINLKGHALEPGEGLTDFTDAKHYHYRGEWIRDSKAVSFEESGVGVIKTYDDDRPEFEEIINDEDNETRDLGPPLPPRTKITGSIVSEGSRGLRPADGSHLLNVGSDALGITDTGDKLLSTPYSDAPSLAEYNTDVSSNADRVFFYDSNPYWIDEVSSANWKVTTGETGSLVQTTNLTHHSSGSFFKEGFFICWDNQYIQTVELAPSSMTIDTFNTIDKDQGGDVGTPVGATTGTGTVSKAITGVDICNGVITFSQEMQTERLGVTEYDGSDNEVWLLPPRYDSVLFLLRDGEDSFEYGSGHSLYEDPVASTGDFDDADNVFEFYTQGGTGAPTKRSAEWNTPTVYEAQYPWGDGGRRYAHETLGIKWAAAPVKAGTYTMVKYVGADKPQIYLVGKYDGDSHYQREKSGGTVTDETIKGITVTRDLQAAKVYGYRGAGAYDTDGRFHSNRKGAGFNYYTVVPKITINIPQLGESIEYVHNIWQGHGATEHGVFYHFKSYVTSDHHDSHSGRWYDGHQSSYQYWTGGFGWNFWDRLSMGGTYIGIWGAEHEQGVPRLSDEKLIEKERSPRYPIIDGVRLITTANQVSHGWIKTLSAGFWNGRSMGDTKQVNDTGGTEVAFLNRVCSYDPSASPITLTLQKKCNATRFWTAAEIKRLSKTTGTISFTHANDTLFTVGDLMRVASRYSTRWAKPSRFGGYPAYGGNTEGARTLSWNASVNFQWRQNPPQNFKSNQYSYFTARITQIDNTAEKIHFEIFNMRVKGTLPDDHYGVTDEKCYPIIDSINPFKELDGRPYDEGIRTEGLSGSTRKVIHTDLTDHVLIGHHIMGAINTQKIEVRGFSGAASTNTEYLHTIDFEQLNAVLSAELTYSGGYYIKIPVWENRDIRAINNASSPNEPRIFYTDMNGSTLYSQNGAERHDEGKGSPPFSRNLTAGGIYYLTDSLVTVVDDEDITVYNLHFNTKYVKSKPELSRGLGIKGAVQDAMHFDHPTYGLTVFVKTNNKWKLIRTSTVKTVEGVYSETSLLNYNFHKPLYYDPSSLLAWAIHRSTAVDSLTITTAGSGYSGNGTLSAEVVTGSGGSGFAGTYTVTSGAVTAVVITAAGSGYTSLPTIVLTPTVGTAGSGAVITPTSTTGYNIHKAIPFWESDLRGSYVYYKDAAGTKSAWGQVKKIRLGVADASGNIPRYLSMYWQFDTGTYSGANGTLAIGLNHETGKLDGEDNEFIWYPLNSPSPLMTSQMATVISSPKIKIKFKSRVTRDVVFFKEEETVLPSTGQTGVMNRINFLNYVVAAQNFYVLNDMAFKLHGGVKAKEKAVVLGQAHKIESGYVAFDASRVGISAFLVGAPNMFNKNGPNIDFYYRASFVDKWNHESAPSPLPEEGIAPLDSADDCIQLNLSKDFFHFENTDIEKIRMYRYGGDSSEFMFLRDIPMPDISSLPVSLTGLAAYFARKTATSQFYELRTYDDITILSNFVNTNFTMTATASGGSSSPSDLDGVWNIDSLEESTSPNASGTTDYSSTLVAAGIDEVDTDIDVVAGGTSNTAAWPAQGVVKIGEEYILYDSIDGITLKDCTRGYYVDETNAIAHDGGVAIHVVEWLLEIEHRNQDTAKLETAIEIVIGTSSTVPVTKIYVDDASLFQSSNGQILIGNEIYNYVSVDLSSEDNRHAIVDVTHNTGGSLPTIHEEGVVVFSYAENYSEVTAVTNMSIVIDSYGYRDKARTPIASLFYMQEDNYPPLGLEYNEELKGFYETGSDDDFFRYIKAVGSMYFAGLDSDLRFSRYGSAEYWPLDAVITLDSEIRAIKEYAGEGLVWTTNSLYRVRGTDPKAMVAFRVPDAHGVKAGDEHTVEEFNGGVLWLTANDGIAFYGAGKVTYLTRDKHIVTDLVKPKSCVSEGVYWLFQRPGSGNGFRLELSGNEMRLCQTTIEGYYAHYAKSLGKAVVVTSDDELSDTDSAFSVSEIGGQKANSISWKSKKIDAGEPAIAKALGSLAIVYEALNYKFANTFPNGIRGQSQLASLLNLDPSDLDAGNLNMSGLDETTDLYDIFTKYDQASQTYEIDLDGEILNEDERRIVVMPLDFDTDSISIGDVIWNEMFEDHTIVNGIKPKAEGAAIGDTSEDVVASGSADLLFTDSTHGLSDGDVVHFTASTTLPGNITVNTNYFVNDKTDNNFKVETVVGGGNVQYSSTLGSGVAYVKKILYPYIELDKEPLRSGSGIVYWGNLPIVDVFINNETIASRSFVLPPTESIEPQSIDLYLTDLRRFRTISIQINGNVRIQTVSLRHYPLQNYQTQTLHHSADVFYKGEIDFRVMLDGNLIYRQELAGAGDEFKEQRIYLPASSYGQRVHYMNESKNGMIESVKFNGSLAA